MGDHGTQQADLRLQALENLRIRLLDLSSRNRLLNFKHSKTGSLRIIDELPNQLHEVLLSEKRLRLIPVPEPTRQQLIDAGYITIDEEGREERVKKDPIAEQWARWLGLVPQYELPEPHGAPVDAVKHKDDAIQTLLFPHELETRLRGLRGKAETALQETGANILYLALGFLEWYESPNSDVARLAPLVLMPICLHKGEINRATRTYEYTVSHIDEDILPNLSLREKLRVDFGLALPELDEDTAPEAYFAEVQALIDDHQPRWRLKRFGTMALLNFSKLLMYLDLDPQRWPEEASLASHPVVARFLGAAPEDKAESAGGFSDEHAIDDIPDVHELYPLIDDADSSQHSALVDVLQGKNLVIEGPPGTGKSQTITNFIAAAIAQGKRVLFVAEKMAALEVVKGRLDRAGLGDFCLELHSHKTQKRKVLDEIGQRLAKQERIRPPREIDADLARYNSLRDQLRRHAELVNKPWKGTGQTIHEILMAATRYRERLPEIDPADIHPEGLDGRSFGAGVRRESLDTIKRFGKLFIDILAQLTEGSPLQSHPWFGVSNPRLQFFDADRVSTDLRAWQEALGALSGLASVLSDVLELDAAALPGQLTELKGLRDDLKRLPELTGDERLSCLPDLQGNRLTSAQQYLAINEELQAVHRTVVQKIGQDLATDRELYQRLHEAEQVLRRFGVREQLGLEAAAHLLRDLKRLEDDLQEFLAPVDELTKLAGASELLGIHETGLKELAQLIKIAGELKPALWRHRDELFDADELDEVLPELTETLARLREVRDELSPYFRMDGLPEADSLDQLYATLIAGGMFRWLRRDWRQAKQQTLVLGKAQVPLAKLKEQLPRLVEFVREKREFDGDVRLQELLGDHFKGLETPDADVAALRAWYRQVRQAYGVGFGAKAALGEALLDMPSSLAKAFRAQQEQGLLRQTEQALVLMTRLKEMLPGIEGLARGAIPLIGPSGVLPAAISSLEQVLQACAPLADRQDFSLGELAGLVRQLAERGRLVAERRALKADVGTLVAAVSDLQGAAARIDAIRRTVALAKIVAEELSSRALVEVIYSDPTPERFARLSDLRLRLEQALTQEAETCGVFARAVDLDAKAWQGEAGDDLKSLQARNERALTNVRWLGNWLDYLRLRHSVQQAGFGRLALALERGQLAVEAVADGYHLAVSDCLAREILVETPKLAEFGGRNQEGLQQQFRDYDHKLKRLQREKIAWQIAQCEIPDGNGTGRVSGFTDLALLRHECAKKKRHLPIRQLIARAGEALVGLKPCFMMGPMSVAQYLAPEGIKFDLVVMDEASQIKPQDALGAIARGAQVVVVGDPKQLPPTSFFDRLVGEDEDDPTTLEESESILDATLPMFSARRLRWHYRSQHESLIAFSNRQFYDGDLVLFPSPHSASRDHGVKFVRVKRGRFVNRRNLEEAQAVAEAVRSHLLNRSDETLGVVAMSADQREQIERAVEVFAKDDAPFQAALDRDARRDESLFIKNLENVQGDERDVIYISFTYGPQEVGARVPQRFGPINSDMGWRRLNVLFTRSRRRMHIFSSMVADDIVVGENSKRGVRALKDFLSYAERGVLPQMEHVTGRAPDSDFEVAVAAALSRAGYESVPQVGVAGFYIDLAVKDPGNPGRYLMGIECDGATYHSAKSVRDRDRLRQEILEGLGWRIRRIWSTDWYKNPEAEIIPILRELESLKSTPLSEAEHGVEVDEIASLVESLDAEEESVAEYAATEAGLADRLHAFDVEVIRKELPDTPEAERLLRPAMLEAFVEYRPTSKSEFLELIPPYLRQSTSTIEGRGYLGRVLAIIEEAPGPKCGSG
ncbi:DUF4011 domain-containing anti-phage protein Hhe [Alkalilimnicola sp. S0819]|uniref:DUF4011 domain-containing anti-phage protein Hhe n=1 Tax=Alkalilimnicola sp. S0819 TaxID=2613922 RepID=UPI00186A99E8|nr:DUF4011 domain-containing anti-phage protein Hhe [Alkalilimnicola sp. S0819]